MGIGFHMDNTKSGFKERKIEIDEYFNFIEVLNNDNISLEFTNLMGIDEKFEISIKLKAIVRANAFLLLYNLIESTITNSILEIYTKIKDEKVSYECLSSEIKKIWLNKKRKTIADGNNLTEVIDTIIEKKIIELTKNDINISGNIDSQKIRNLAKEIGFNESKNGRCLEGVKDKRNHLAHGEQTFYNIGKSATYNDLNKEKEDIFQHLEDVIRNIENFIEAKKYKKI